MANKTVSKFRRFINKNYQVEKQLQTHKKCSKDILQGN